MMSAKDWQETLDKALAVLDAKVAELVAPPFGWTEVVGVIKAAVETAEALITAPGSGADKTALVMAIWNHYNKEYKLTEKLDNLVDFAKILGHPIGDFVELWDEKALSMLIEKVIIPTLVAALFPKKKTA